MNPTLSQRLGTFAAETMRVGAPETVRASVRRRILDIVGLQAAALPLDTSAAASSFVLDQGGAGQANIVGSATLVPAPWAAFVNGVLAHSLDYDDTHLPSVLHPSAAVVPATIAAAQLADAGGSAVLDAAAVGIETVVRIGMVGYDRHKRSSVFFEHGQHATSICGTLGAAAATAALLDLGSEGVVNAIGVAASMASGIIEGNRTGGTVKRLHCGWAAQVGVTAAMLVNQGFTGPPTALEGRFGLFEAFLHDEGDQSAITDGLGESWAVPGIFFKPYPANHFTHTALDAATRLREGGLRPEDIDSIELGVASATVRTIGEPLTTKQQPDTGYQAQFSGPYLVALGLFGGHGLGAGLEDFTDELARDPERRALMARVHVVPDAECDAVFPDQFPAVLRVRTHDGRTMEERVEVNRGGPKDPLTDTELMTKFRQNAGRSFSEARTARAANLVEGLDGSGPEHVAELAAVFSAAPDAPGARG